MKVCIFDLDGTLTDTLESLVYSVNLSLEEIGLSQITREQCESFVGNGARKLIEKALIAAGDEGASRLEEGMEVYGRVFAKNCTYHVVPYDGIVEMLHHLQEKGIKLGVLSNKPHNQTVDVVRQIFGEGIFDWVQGQKEGVPRKPDPAGVFQILEYLGAEKEECTYVGDSEVDIATGHAAKVQTIAVDWGFRSREVLEEAGAEIIISSPQQLVGYLV